MLAHALTFAGRVFPLANLLAPALVGWWNRESAYVRFNARSSLGFQVSCLIYEAVGLGAAGACYLVWQSQSQGPGSATWLVAASALGLGLLCLFWIAAAACMVLNASERAHAGMWWRYPLTLRFLR